MSGEPLSVDVESVVEHGSRPPKGRARLRVIALASFPVEAAATRFRIAQYIEPLSRAGIDVTLLPFLTSADIENLYDRRRAPVTALRLVVALVRRLIQLRRILTADVLFVQREAMLFGPPLIEWLAARVAGIPLVLDLDDATWIAMRSPVYGGLAALLKSAGKANWLIRQAGNVICGNKTIARYVDECGVQGVVLPTIVDSSVFRPSPEGKDSQNELPIVGWVGSHSTWSYLLSILPVLEAVAESIPFRLRIVGSGQKMLSLRGIEVELRDWQSHREVHDFQTLDIGLYPLPADAWAEAKSGLKAVQYLACGVPYVASPVGVVREIGEAGVTHLLAADPGEWRMALERLLRDREERGRMGAAGRRHMLERYVLGDFALRIAEVLRDAAPAEDRA